MLLSRERRQQRTARIEASDASRSQHAGSVLSSGYPPRFVPPMTTVRSRGSPAESFEIPYLVTQHKLGLALLDCVDATACSGRSLLDRDGGMLRKPRAQVIV